MLRRAVRRQNVNPKRVSPYNEMAETIYDEARDDLICEYNVSDADVENDFELPAQLPSVIPTGSEIISDIRAAQHMFKSVASLPLTEEVAHCRDFMAKNAAPLFAFSRLLAEDQRRAIWVLHSVCHAFETVPTYAELDNMRHRMRRAFNADLDINGLDGRWRALRATLKRYALTRRPFEDFADSIANRPQKGMAFQTTDDLLSSAYRESGVVGLIALPVLVEGVALDKHMVEGAIALGIALKLTDVLNCVGHHYRTLGTCWIPRDCLKRHNVSEDELRRNLLQESQSLVDDIRFKSIMRELLDLVPPLLKRASKGGEMLPRGACIAVRTAVRMCSRMVAKIEARGYNSIGQHEEMFTWRIAHDVTGAVWGPAGA